MTDHADSAFDSLTKLVQVIGRDRNLFEWFRQLDQMSADERRNQIFRISDQMTAAEKDPDIVKAFRLLADPRMFDAARLALQDSGYIAS